MAKKQTRRGISMSRLTYDKFKAHSERVGLPMSQVMEALIEKHIPAQEPTK